MYRLRKVYRENGISNRKVNVTFLKPANTVNNIARAKLKVLPIILRCARYKQRVFFVDEAMFTGG